MKPTILLFNGPPGCGKDTAARHIEDQCNESIQHPPCLFERFSFPNKRAFAASFNAAIDEYGHVMGWEQMKDKPHWLLNNKSYRQWQIDFSESFMKPLYGEDIFGRLLVERVRVSLESWPGDHPFIVVPDSGFQVEVEALNELRNDVDCHLIRITGRGTFAGDSRGFVEPAPWMKFDVAHNNADLQRFLDNIDIIVGTTWKDKINAA